MNKLFKNNLLLANFFPVLTLNLIFFFIALTVTNRVKYSVILWTINNAVFPITLTISNLVLAFKSKVYIFIKRFLIIVLTMITGNILHYLIWGITTGMLFKPDGETIYIFSKLIVVGFKFVFFSSLVAQIVLLVYKFFIKTRTQP